MSTFSVCVHGRRDAQALQNQSRRSTLIGTINFTYLPNSHRRVKDILYYNLKNDFATQQPQTCSLINGLFSVCLLIVTLAFGKTRSGYRVANVNGHSPPPTASRMFLSKAIPM